MAGFGAAEKLCCRAGLTRIKVDRAGAREDRGRGGRDMRSFKGLIAAALMALPAAAQDAEVGAELYGDFCAVCHGEDARGGGPMAALLTLPPTDLTALTVDGEFPLTRVARQIDGRRPMLAHGGEMPIYGRYFEGQGADVAMTGEGGQPVMLSRPIADLIAYLLEVQE
jgi:mono/diheme cytochrome c family protein